MLKVTSSIKLLSLVLALAAAVLVFQNRAPQTTGQAQAATSTSSQDPDGYAVLGRPADRGDDISNWRSQGNPQLGLQKSAARVVLRTRDKVVAAIPATNAPCLATQYGNGGGEGMSCATEPGSTTATLTYNGAIGLVPNSVRTVTFTMSDGSEQTADVRNNLWVSPAEAAKVTFRLRGRDEELRLLPRSTAPEGSTISEDGLATIGGPGN